jgi:hypothetical protein
MKRIPKFFVQVPCKPYVKQFIEDNYGFPPDFSKDATVHRMFNRLLKEPSHHRDCDYPQPPSSYSEIVEIMISERDFYHYGFELSKTDIINFGKFFEGRCKFIMRTHIGILRSLGLPYYIDIFYDRNPELDCR